MHFPDFSPSLAIPSARPSLLHLFSTVVLCCLCAFFTFSSTYIASASWFCLRELQIHLSIPDPPATFSRCFAINIRRIKRAFDLSNFSLLGSY